MMFIFAKLVRLRISAAPGGSSISDAIRSCYLWAVFTASLIANQLSQQRTCLKKRQGFIGNESIGRDGVF